MAKDGRRVTLQDIAKRSGYSITTVSRSLRGKRDINPETAARIRNMAQEMGYVADETALSLRYGRTNLISVILVDMTNPFYSIMTQRLQLAAEKLGYSLVISCDMGNPKLEQQSVERAIARGADGVILFPTDESAPAIARLKSIGMPFVLMASYLKQGDADAVVADDEQGAYLATMHLIEKGKRRLAYLSSSDTVTSGALHKAGFLRACDQAGIPEADRCLYTTSYHKITPVDQPSWHEELSGKLLELKREGFNGFFVFCDIEAWHVIDMMTKTGAFNDVDFGIAAFDNIDGALFSPIPLCTIDSDSTEMARCAMELLHARIEGQDFPPQTIVRPVRLVCRGSCQTHGIKGTIQFSMED